jgi:hypothetical protein
LAKKPEGQTHEFPVKQGINREYFYFLMFVSADESAVQQRMYMSQRFNCKNTLKLTGNLFQLTGILHTQE